MTKLFSYDFIFKMASNEILDYIKTFSDFYTALNMEYNDNVVKEYLFINFPITKTNIVGHKFGNYNENIKRFIASMCSHQIIHTILTLQDSTNISEDILIIIQHFHDRDNILQIIEHHDLESTIYPALFTIVQDYINHPLNAQDIFHLI